MHGIRLASNEHVAGPAAPRRGVPASAGVTGPLSEPEIPLNQAVEATECPALGHSFANVDVHAAPYATRGRVIQRQANTPADSAGDVRGPDLAHQASLDELMTQITEATGASLGLRAQMEALPPSSSQQRTELEAALDTVRSSLIGLLQRRIELLTAEIVSLNALIGPVRTSSAGHPEMDALANELFRREEELRQHERQLRPLLRWQTRQEIATITAQLADIDQELATLPPVSDPLNPAAELLALRRNELERRRNAVARTLTAGAAEYKQFDPRWGAIRYGPSAQCTNIKQAGCGPTSLAIVLNYLYQEDPEMLAESSGFEIVTPPETAAYAATHGRVCNNGTSGDTMVTQVGTGWPGFTGRRISLTQTAAELRAGNLVIFLCHDCTGRKQSGGPKHYGGHFMVLSAVSDDGSTYNVLDPGAAEANDIETISREELVAHTGGFWFVGPK